MAEAPAPEVKWEEIHEVLPTRQDPDSRKARQALFKEFDKEGGKAGKKTTLTIDEVQAGMSSALRYEVQSAALVKVIKLKPIVKSAFKQARDLGPSMAPKKEGGKSPPAGCKKKPEKLSGSLDKTEFHPFLVAFKYYLEVHELFEKLDSSINKSDDDQMLSLREAKKGMDTFKEWGIEESVVLEKFAGAEAWKPHISLEDFSDWCVEHRCKGLDLKLDDSDNAEVQAAAAATLVQKDATLDATKALGEESELNKGKILDEFKKFDADNSGGISEEELACVMKELDPRFTAEAVKKIFKIADKNSDGNIDYKEFCEWMFTG